MNQEPDWDKIAKWQRLSNAIRTGIMRQVVWAYLRGIEKQKLKEIIQNVCGFSEHYSRTVLSSWLKNTSRIKRQGDSIEHT